MKPTRKDLERSRIERCLATLEDAVNRCRKEDVRYGTGIFAALQFLEMQAQEKWPFQQFREALEEASRPTKEGKSPVPGVKKLFCLLTLSLRDEAFLIE